MKVVCVGVDDCVRCCTNVASCSVKLFYLCGATTDGKKASVSPQEERMEREVSIFGRNVVVVIFLFVLEAIPVVISCSFSSFSSYSLSSSLFL